MTQPIDPTLVAKPLLHRAALAVVLDRCVAGPNDCSVFVGDRNQKGYGRVFTGSNRYLAHRVAYEAAKGRIPERLVIDHLCRNPACCNPHHLEAVTSAENTRRGESVNASKARSLAQTHCKHGHLRSEENIYRDRRGYGQCRICAAARKKVSDYERRGKYRQEFSHD